MGLTYGFAPNMSKAAQTTPASTSWTQLTLPASDSSTGIGASLLVQSLNAAGTAAGDAFQILTNQTGTPAGGDLGVMVYPNIIYPVDGLPSNVWVKLVTSTDLINATLVF